VSDAALTERATGSSIVKARTVTDVTAIIFFMVDDPSRIATLITLKTAEALVAGKRVQKSEQRILWNLLTVIIGAGACLKTLVRALWPSFRAILAGYITSPL
jgi:hypothetical protein